MPGYQEPHISNYLDWANKGHPAFWRYGLALVLSLLFWLLGPIPLAILFSGLFRDPKLHAIGQQVSFLPGFIAILLIVWLVLGRPAWSVALPRWPPRLADYAFGVMGGWVIAIISTVLFIPVVPLAYQGWAAETALGFPLVLLMLAGFLIQTGFEELLFRGLLMQFTYRFSRSVPLAVIIQALLFGVLHIGNVVVYDNNPLVMLPYFLAALTWGWVAWRTGSLLVSAGLHFAGNSFNTLAIGTKGDILSAYGPFVSDLPSITIVAVGVAIQSALTVVAVEFYVRQRNSRLPRG
jgi:uncharacterized protein